MRSSSPFLSCAVALAFCLAPAVRAQDLLIRDVTLLSGQNPSPLDNMDVLILDGDIARVSPTGSEMGARPGSVQEIDGRGLFLTPRLIDSHVHLYHSTGLRRGLVDETRFDDLQQAYWAQMPRSFLYWGFTTVVELDAGADEVALFESRPQHPDLIHCSQGLITSNGFMASQIGPRALQAYPHYLHDRFVTTNLPDGEDPSRHTPAAAVDAIEARGGQCVKLYHEEAPWLPDGAGWPHPSLEIVREVVAEAEARGLPVFLHGATATSHRLGMAGGVTAMAHGTWEMGGDLLDPEIPHDILDLIDETVSSDIRIQPTLRTIGQTRSMFDPGILDDPEWRHVVPQAFHDYLITDAQPQKDQFIGFFADSIASREDMLPIMRNYHARYLRVLAMIEARSDALVFATDSSTGTFGWGNPPGLNGFWEMRELASAGISARDIFDMATVRNADLLGQEHRLGTVEVGKRANLLLMSSNPWESVEAYRDIEWVILGGEVIARETLSALQTEELSR